MKRKIIEEENEEYEGNEENPLKRQKIEEKCPICLNNIEKKNIVVTKCAHKFCFDCLMKSCDVKNECPLCRMKIDEYKNKKLPIFRRIDLFDNLLYSYICPSYNLFNEIDKIRNIIYEEIIKFNNIFDEEEKETKNKIIEKIKNDEIFKNLLDIILYNQMQLFTDKVIISNTNQMCEWYNTNYNIQ